MVVVINPSEGKPSIGKSIRNLTAVTRVGLDLAKNAFQVHAVDATGAIVCAVGGPVVFGGLLEGPRVALPVALVARADARAGAGEGTYRPTSARPDGH
jgi:hypothetical protein